MQYIREGATTKVRIGPAMSTDGVTPITTLSIASANQAEVLKHNGAATAAMTGVLAAITSCDGWYDYTLTATDSGTLGIMTIVIQDSTLMLPIFKDFMIVPANTYDSLIAGTANINADILSINSSTDAASNLQASAELIILGITTVGGTTTIFETDIGGEYTIDDALNGRVIAFRSDTSTLALRGQSQFISSYDATTGEITLAGPLSVAPLGTDTFAIV